MDLDSIADELYAAAPEDFVALRKQRASEARGAGDRTLAQQVGALRRPTRSAWIVNLIAGQAADDLAALLDLGAALAEAQQRLSGTDLRRLSGQRHAAIAALTRRGGQLAEVRGHRPAEATMREVSQTLQAALSDPEIAEVVRAGHLAQAQSYGGFGPELSVATLSATTQASAGTTDRLGAEPPQQPAGRGEQDTVDDPRGGDQDEQAEAAHQRLLDALSTAQAAYDRIAVQTERATEHLTRLTEKADRQTAQVDDLREQLARAESALTGTTEEVERQQAKLAALLESQRSAEDEVSAALTALTGD